MPTQNYLIITITIPTTTVEEAEAKLTAIRNSIIVSPDIKVHASFTRSLDAEADP